MEVLDVRASVWGYINDIRLMLNNQEIFWIGKRKGDKRAAIVRREND